MKVILKKDIKGIGKEGDVRIIKDGFARNFLIPRGLAELATEAGIERVEVGRDAIIYKTKILKKHFENLRASSRKAPILFSIKVGEKGEIYDSVTKAEIRKKILKDFPDLRGYNLKIEADHIKELGKHEIEISVGQGIEGRVVIEVASEIQK